MKQTTKSLVGVLALVVVAGGIAGAALWAGKDEEKKAAQKEKSEKLFDFDKTRVRSLRLSKAGKLVAALERKDAGATWQLTEPIKAAGDDFAVNALVDALAGLKQKKDLGDEKDGKPYGLETPAISVTVRTDDGKESGLEIGADNPFDNTVYLRKAGDPTIRLADAASKAPFDKQLFDLRDKMVAQLGSADEVKRLEVTGTRVPYTLEKDGSAWKLVAPAGVADSAVADRLATALRMLRATSVAAETAPLPAAFGLAPPKITVKLSAVSGKDTVTRKLLFGDVRQAVTAKTYARREGAETVYEVDGQILKDLDKDLFDLQDKALVHASREDVRKLVFEVPGAPRLEIARSKATPPDGGSAEESFAVVAPQKGTAKKWKLSSALFSLTGLRAAAFVEKPKDLSKLGKPRVVTVLGDGDKVLARLQVFGETPEHRRTVLADGLPRLAQVEKAAVDDLPWKLDDALDLPAPAAAPGAAAPDGGVAAAQH